MNWDEYFYSICEAVGGNSKCMSRKIGAILVSDKAIIATGYNGPPRGVPHCKGKKCPRKAKGYISGEGLHLCPAAHAERNAIVQAARHGTRVKGSTLYLNTNIPCAECLKEIINAGIVEIVCTKLSQYDHLSGYLLTNSDIKIRVFEHIK